MEITITSCSQYDTFNVDVKKLGVLENRIIINIRGDLERQRVAKLKKTL